MLHLRKLGETAELVFMARAAALGLTILKPNSPCRYDLVLDTGRRLLRVQVKSTAALRHRRYSVSCFSCDSRRRYTSRDIDFLAAWIVPLNTWYIIPVRALRRRARVYFYPSRRGWSARFREAWSSLLDPKSPITDRRSGSCEPPPAFAQSGTTAQFGRHSSQTSEAPGWHAVRAWDRTGTSDWPALPERTSG